MARSKYINTFNTTTDYDAYIESVQAEFPNVAYDKEAGTIKIVRTSPNDHLIYGEVNDINATAPSFKFNNTGSRIASHIDTVSGTFYLDTSDLSSVTIPCTSLALLCYGQSNIKSLLKFKVNTSSLTTIAEAFSTCSNLVSVNLSGMDITSSTDFTRAWQSVSKLTDIYVSSETVLNAITNNLSSSGTVANAYRYPSTNVTIHYNGTDYKWQNNAWTAQS